MIPALVDGAANESSGWQRERSDSDVAREMQAEMDESVLLDTSNPSKEDGIHSESKNIGGNRMRSDSEVARELQAKWNSEEFDPSDTAAITSSENLDTLSSMSTLPFLSNRASSAPISSSPSIRSHLHRHDRLSNESALPIPTRFFSLKSFFLYPSLLSFAGEDAAQHLLYHFNGLESAGRLACLTSFKLMPRSSENAIGVSVALGGQSDNGPGGFSNPIEEVRTDFTFS